MWQEMNEVSERAEARAESAKQQHQFDIIIEQLCTDYMNHSGRKPTKYEINTLFRKRPDGGAVKVTAYNKAVALSVIGAHKLRNSTMNFGDGSKRMQTI